MDREEKNNERCKAMGITRFPSSGNEQVDRQSRKDRAAAGGEHLLPRKGHLGWFPHPKSKDSR